MNDRKQAKKSRYKLLHFRECIQTWPLRTKSLALFLGSPLGMDPDLQGSFHACLRWVLLRFFRVYLRFCRLWLYLTHGLAQHLATIVERSLAILFHQVWQLRSLENPNYSQYSVLSFCYITICMRLSAAHTLPHMSPGTKTCQALPMPTNMVLFGASFGRAVAAVALACPTKKLLQLF